MFCNRQNDQGSWEPCFVIWYKDPIHVQEERRPPSVNALDELRNLGNGVQAVEMMAFWREESRIKVSHGLLQYEYGKLHFDDNCGLRHSLGYPDLFVPQNKFILSLNDQKHIDCTKFRVPVLSAKEIRFKEIEGLRNLSDAWLGALVVSRAKITLFMIMNIVKNWPYTENPFTMESCEHPQRVTESSEMSTHFLLFVPTAKPKLLQEFLDSASVSRINEKESLDMLQRSFPLHEGYYGVHVHRIRRDIEEKCYEATVRFDDYGGSKEKELWHGRIDFGRTDGTIQKLGVPEEKERGYLSLDMPTLLNSKHSKTSCIGFGDWGFTGCIENTEVFMVPYKMKNEELLEQNRSRGTMKYRRRRILSRHEAVYASLNLSSVDNKYKLIKEYPDFEEILQNIKYDNQHSPQKSHRDTGSISSLDTRMDQVATIDQVASNPTPQLSVKLRLPLHSPKEEQVGQETAKKSFGKIEKNKIGHLTTEQHQNNQDGIPETLAPPQTSEKPACDCDAILPRASPLETNAHSFSASRLQVMESNPSLAALPEGHAIQHCTIAGSTGKELRPSSTPHSPPPTLNLSISPPPVSSIHNQTGASVSLPPLHLAISYTDRNYWEKVWCFAVEAEKSVFGGKEIEENDKTHNTNYDSPISRNENTRIAGA